MPMVYAKVATATCTPYAPPDTSAAASAGQPSATPPSRLLPPVAIITSPPVQ